MIYDEESDRHVHISFEAALDASCYGLDNGPNLKSPATPSDLFEIMKFSNDSHAGKKYEAHYKAYKAGIGDARKYTAFPTADDLAKGVCKLNEQDTLEKVKTSYEAYVTLGNLRNVGLFAVAFAKTCVRLGIWCPVEIVIARPFIEHLMLSGIVTVAGRDTGATLFGPADMQISVRSLELKHSTSRIPPP